MVVYVIVIIQNGFFFLLSVLLAVVVTHFFSLDVLKKISWFRMYLATQREEFRVYNGCDVEALV